MNHSNYNLPVDIRELDRIKFTHLECCSLEELKQNIVTEAKNQIRLYQNVIELIDNLNLAKIHEFETKYGTYEELCQDQEIDHHVRISALISELRKRIGTE